MVLVGLFVFVAVRARRDLPYEPDTAQVLAALKNGGAGSGTMPPRLYQGNQAQQVADYITAVTGGG